MRHILVLIFCIIFTDLSFGQGDAPALLQGQHQSTKSVGSFIQAPNKQITKISGATSLVETGNQNLLENPSFEHPTVGFGWTDASTNTKSAEATVVIHGKKSLKIVLSANDINLTQESTLYASQFGGTTQGVASIRIKTDVLVKICTVEAGIVSTTNCLDSSLDNQWHIYKIPFVLGATSNGINIAATGVTGTVYLDDAFVGAMEVTAVTDASRIAGEAVFAPTSSCLWSRSSPTIGAFSSTSACPGPTIVKQHVGNWQTTDTNLPQITVNSLPAGVYKATFFVPTYSGITAQNAIAINDGTTTCAAVNVNSSTISGQGVVSCTFEYSTAANRTFSLYGSSTTSTINIENNTSGDATRGVKFQLEYYTSFSSYSSLNADTDWVDMGTIIWSTTGGAQTKGTTTQDKVLMKRTGVNAELIYKFQQTGGAVGSGEYLYTLPAGLQFDTSVITPYSGAFTSALEQAGQNALIGYGHITTGSGTSRGIAYLFAYNNTQFRVIASSGFSSWQVQNASYFASGSLGFNFRITVPISTWNNSNIIIGQFNGLESCASTLDCTDTFSAKVSSTGVVTSENVDFINGNCAKPSAGIANCSFNTGVFTVTPTCVANRVIPSQTTWTSNATWATIGQISSTQVYVLSTTTTEGAAEFNLVCQKQGVDYVGKTAKAVASDQNLRIPGTTKSVTYVEEIECDTSSSLVRSLSGSSMFLSLGNISSGNCSFTLKSGLFTGEPYCITTYISSTSSSVSFSPIFSTPTTGIISCDAGTGPCSGGGPLNISCTGITP